MGTKITRNVRGNPQSGTVKRRQFCIPVGFGVVGDTYKRTTKESNNDTDRWDIHKLTVDAKYLHCAQGTHQIYNRPSAHYLAYINRFDNGVIMPSHCTTVTLVPEQNWSRKPLRGTGAVVHTCLVLCLWVDFSDHCLKQSGDNSPPVTSSCRPWRNSISMNVICRGLLPDFWWIITGKSNRGAPSFRAEMRDRNKPGCFAVQIVEAPLST